MAPSSTSPRSSARTSSSTLRARLQPAQFAQPGGAAAAVRRPRRRQRQSARHDHDRRHQSVQSVRTLRGTISARPTRHLRLHRPPRRRERAAPLRPEVDTYYVAATLDGSFELLGHDWYWDVNGVWGRNEAEQDGARQHQRRQPRPRARARSRPAPRPACRSTSSAARGRSPSRCSIMSPSPSATAASSELWDVSANLTGGLFDLPGGPVGIAIGVEHRDQSGPVRPRSDRRRRPRLRHSGAADLAAATMSTRPMPSCGCRCSRDTRFFHRLELTGAARYSDYSTSGSTTTFSAGINWEPIEDLLFRGSWAEGFRAPEHRRIVRHAVALRPGGRRSLLGHDRGDSRPTSAPIASPRAFPPTAATSSSTRSCRWSPAAITHLDPETSESWGVGAVWRPSFLPRLSLEANYYNIRVDGAIQAIDAGTLLGRCADTGDALSCAAIDRSASGQVTADPRPPAEHRQHRDRRPRRHPELPQPARPARARSACSGPTPSCSTITVTVPATNGVTVIDREGTEQGSPDQAFPEVQVDRRSSTGRWASSAPR